MFGNIQDAHVKQSAQIKNSLVANGGIGILLSIIRCSDPLGPQFDFDQNIFQKGAPDWVDAFVFQADATLALRRLLEVGKGEMKSGQKRVHQAVLEGALAVLVPHLYCTSCAAQYASGALKLIAQYEMYRQNICDAGALSPLLLLLKADPEVEKSSFRHAVECLHLLSCSTTVHFEELGILEACLQAAVNNKAGEKPVLLSVLCAANITAGQDDAEISKRMEVVYGQVHLGVHICRWLSTSLNDKEGPYFTIRCSQMDMLRSVCFLATSEVGRSQLISSFIKEGGSQKQLTMVDILMRIVSHPTIDEEIVDVILEIFLHLAFSDGGANLIRTCKTCLPHIRGIAEAPVRGSTENEDIGDDTVSGENKIAARNILSVLKGSLQVIVPSRPKTPQRIEMDQNNSAPSATAKEKKKKKIQRRRKQRSTEEESEGEIEEEIKEEADDEVDSEDGCDNEDEDEDENDTPPITSNPFSQAADSSDVSAGPQPLPHIMISYSWAHQDSIIDICKHLKSAGLPYWLDIEQMHGEINDRMAEAIESCGVVIVGISSKYKLSANCRMEAEYSNASRKQIIPLMMETGYRADGWLGLLTAGKLWYGVSYDDPSREENISSMVEVVKAAVQKEAATMSQDSLSRSVSLFNKTTAPSAGAATQGKRSDTPTCVVNATTAVAEKKEEGSGPLIATHAEGESERISLDSISLLFDQMQTRIQDSMSQQLSPVINSLNNIDQRLSKIESQLKNI